MSELSTVRLVHRYPNVGTAEHAAAFLPTCGWRPVEDGGWYWLEFTDAPHRAKRTHVYLTREYPRMRFALRDT